MSLADLSRLPSVSALLADPRLRDVPHAVAVRSAREVVAELRAELRGGGALPDDPGARVAARASALRRPGLVRVVNATGIVLHTNLGRAPLAPEAAAAVEAAARGYCNVELDLATGERGDRMAAVGPLLCAATGAEAAIAVNNNAAGVLLVLTALARGREVVASRGELVEIGGSFRVPEVIAAGGARLVEVGTTNRTRVADYARAVGPDTALLLRVHPSNFRVVGFTERPSRDGLVALARERGVPLVEDLGSGLFGRLPAGGDEDAVEDAIAAGVDLVCFSGDKLLGGPQAGVVAGRADLVRAARAHPLYRALRLDKLVLAALEATVRVVAEGRADELPARAMLARSPASLRAAAERVAGAIPGARVEVDVGYSGGGALPAVELPTVVVSLALARPEEGARWLRERAPPVLARVARDRLLLDPRTLLPGEEEEVVAAVRALLAARGDRG